MPLKPVSRAPAEALAGDSVDGAEAGKITVAPSDKQAPVQAPPPALAPPSGTAAAPEVNVKIVLVEGGITNVEVPVAVAARYDSLPLAAGARAFDRLLDSWLTRALELGMIGSGLGQLYPFNLEKRRQEKQSKIKTDYLLLASMGEPGRFAQDGLRYLMSNIVVAAKGLEQDTVATSLIGTRRNELSVADAIRAMMQGILDGYERFRAIAATATADQGKFAEANQSPFCLMLVAKDADKLKKVREALDDVKGPNSLPGLKLEMLPPRTVAQDETSEPSARDTDAEVTVTLVRVTRAKPAAGAAKAEAKAISPVTSPQGKPPGLSELIDTETFEFSALSDIAAVPVREVEINKYWLRELPPRMIRAKAQKEQARLSTFFSNCILPEEFRKHIETAKNLIFEVDEFSAPFPWEMAAHQAFSRTTFLGTTMAVSRQFRSLLSPPPTAVPPLNRTLKVLVIADPAPEKLSLPGARKEGVAVVKILEEARKAWRGKYSIEATVRIGSKKEGDTNQALDELKDIQCLAREPELGLRPCDPLELAMLIVNEHFDVIHYAGHGFCDSSRSAGWVLAPDCLLSAKEIFRVRQVPRLVFANACFSAVTTSGDEVDGHREKSVGLAQAFFSRGIPNYIGAGWPVGDAAACECARWFYAGVLGLRGLDISSGLDGTAPPATIGLALRKARERISDIEPSVASNSLVKFDHTTWGAYQHYGKVGDKLLPLVNLPGEPTSE